jgi:hypothetical protein
MSSTTRKGLEVLTNTIGKSKNYVRNSFGNTVDRRGFNLESETILTRIKTSNNFHDYDLAGKPTDGYSDPNFLTYNVDDPIGFGIQGGEIYAKKNLSTPFPIYASGTWNPSYDGPPSLEGWDIWLYNGFGSYIPPTLYTNPRTSNTTTYAPYGGENLVGTAFTAAVNTVRSSLSTTSRYTGTYSLPVTSGNYEAVPKFENARWISVRNTYGSTITKDGDVAEIGNPSSLTKKIKVKLHEDVLTGFKLVDPKRNEPRDIKLYYHNNLIQNYTTTWQSITLPTSYTQLTPLDFKIYSYNAFVDDVLNFDTTVDAENYWILEIDLPASSSFSWTNNYWWHIAIYWNSEDDLTTNSFTNYTYNLLEYDMNDISISSSDGSIDVANSNLILWNKKSFFKQTIPNYLDYELTGVYDTNLYLYSQNKTLFKFKDGEYSEPPAPFRYSLDILLPPSNFGDDGSLVGYSEVKRNQLFPISICTENSGANYESPKATYKILTGLPFDRETLSSYENFANWPIVPETYDCLFRCLLTRPVDEVFELVQSENFVGLSKRILESDGIHYNFVNILNTSSIVYLEKVAVNFAKFGVQDQNVLELLLPQFYKLVQFTRNNNYNEIFNNLARQIVPESARLIIGRLDELLSITTNDPNNYQTLIHNLLKKPSATTLKNPDYEPRGLQFSFDGNEVVADFAVRSPSVDLASLTSDHLRNYNFKVPVPSNFEVYQELSLLCEAIDPNISGDKIGLDYTFKLKLQDSNKNILEKDLYLNASKFFLSDEEYNNRVYKGLSVVGYYKTGTDAEQAAKADGTLESIPDYHLYGYAGCIPDLKMQEARPILTRVVGSDKQEGQTREQFIASLPPGTDINEALANYEGDFITIDLNHYPEQWMALKELAMTTSKYSFDTNPYYQINYYALIGGDGKSQGIQTADDYYPYTSGDVKADSFNIATSGLSINDDSINVIENIHNQQTTIDSSYGLSQTTSSTGIAITQPTFGIKITPQLDSSSQSFKLRISNTIPFLSTGTLNVELYSSSASGNTPDKVIKSGSGIALSSISNKMSEYSFGLSANLSANTNYWLVFKSNQEFRTYATNTSGTVACSGTSVTGTGTTFTNYIENSQIGFGSTVPSDISDWYTISSINSNTSLTLTSSPGTISSGTDYVIKHDFKLWGSPTGSSTLSLKDKDNNWGYITGRPYINFFTPSAEILGTFNRTDYSLSSTLPPPNKQREKNPVYNLESYVSFTSKTLNPPQHLQLYPRAFYGGLTKQTTGTVTVSSTSVTASGNSDFLLFTGQDIQIGFGSRNHIDITTWYDVTSIDSSNTLTLSTSASSQTNVEYAIRFKPEWHWAKYSKDIYVYIKYYAKNTLKENFITLNKSPYWQTWWFLSDSNTIDDINQNIELEKAADDTIVTSALNFSGYAINGTTEYLQAKSKGVFYPQTTDSYDFIFFSSYGIKIYINGSNTPVISNLTNTDPSFENTFTLSLVSDELVTFEILHTHKTDILNSNANPQVLVGIWKLSSDTNWNYIDSTFYQDATPTPIDIDPDGEPIDRIVFLTVGKTLEEISTPTHGAPPGDRIVFRSK